MYSPDSNNLEEGSLCATSGSAIAARKADRRVNRILILLSAPAFGLYLIFCEITGWMPACLFHLLTGLDCPGCGCQRAFHAALEGEWAAALRFNLLLPLAVCYLLPLLVLPFLSLSPRSGLYKLYERLTSPTAGWILLSVILLWWIIRNIFHI